MDIQTTPDLFARAPELGADIAAATDDIERTRRIPEALLVRAASWPRDRQTLRARERSTEAIV